MRPLQRHTRGPCPLRGPHAPRGMTLLEVMVAAFLASIVLTILAKVTGHLYRVGTEEVQRGALQARVLLAAKKLEDDLVNTVPAGVGLSADGRRLVAHPMGEVLPSGRILFQEQFELWSWELAAGATEGKLTRSELEVRPDGKPFDGGPYRWPLATFPPVVGPKVSLAVDGVTEFSVEGPDGVALPKVGSPITFTITALLPIATTRRDITITRSVQIRTSGT